MSTTSHATLRITCELVDVRTNDCALRFEVLNPAGQWVGVIIPRSEITHPHKILERLAGKGWIDANPTVAARAEIDHVLQNCSWPLKRVTSLAGWHGDGSFVLPHRTFGAESKSLCFASSPSVPVTGSGGTLDRWRDGLQEPCSASSCLTFASALAMAGALMHPLKMAEGAIFQLTGKSSSGKTLALRVAQSAMRSPVSSSLLTHDMTGRAFEEHLGAANDGLLCIDELARLQGTPSKKRDYLKQLPHVLASGVGRARSKIVELDQLDRKTFRVLGFSTGELPLESYGEREEGERVRFPDIPVPPPAENGIFDRLDDGDTRSLAAQAEATISENYGQAYEAFVKRLIAHREEATKAAQEHLEKFIGNAAPNGTSWDRRFALKFGVVYAAAALASQWGILPFSITHARKCIRRLHKLARVEARTLEEARDALMMWLSATARTSHFPLLKRGEAAEAKNRKPLLGFRRGNGEDRILAVIPEELKSRVTPERHADKVLSLLAEEGILIRGSGNHLVTQMACQGFDVDRPTFYCFDLSKVPREGDLT